MPEVTDLSGSEVTRGFWIRRVASPAVTRPRRLVRAEDNKENVPPAGWVGPTPWRRRGSKSPLPEWYPRTPLRDITAIVNAVERRRLRVQAAARAARVNRETESSPENSPQEQSVIVHNDHIESTPNPIPTYIASSSPVELTLPTPSTSSSISPVETEEKLSKSIDQIEKIVKKYNFKKKKNVKEASDKRRVKQRKTLMSMR